MLWHTWNDILHCPSHSCSGIFQVLFYLCKVPGIENLKNLRVYSFILCSNLDICIIYVHKYMENRSVIYVPTKTFYLHVCWHFSFAFYHNQDSFPIYNCEDFKIINKINVKGAQWPILVKVSASQPNDNGFEPYSGHDHVSSYGTSTGWFQEANSKVIYISCKNLFRNRAYINMFKPNKINVFFILNMFILFFFFIWLW
jgi:hypothetical protein